MRYLIPVLLFACDDSVSIEESADFEAVTSGSVEMVCADAEPMVWDMPVGAVFNVYQCDRGEGCDSVPVEVSDGTAVIRCPAEGIRYIVRYIAPVGVRLKYAGE